MAKPGRKLTLTPALAQKILARLEEDIPFIALAAEACGVNRKTAHQWLEYAEQDNEPCPVRDHFAREVRRIRADWALKIAKELLSADRNTAEAARQKQWLLSRLDKDLFEMTREAGRRVPPEPVPAPVPAPMTKNTEEDLANPEPVH